MCRRVHVLIVALSVTAQRRLQRVTLSNYGTRKGCGIVQEWAKFFYNSQQWHHMRDYCIKRDRYLCQDCLRKGLTTAAEEVHHIIPLTPENITDPSVTLNEENLVSLCRECHRARHGKEKRYSVDEFGRVTIR